MELWIDGSKRQTCHVFSDGEAVLTPLPEDVTGNEAEYYALINVLVDLIKRQPQESVYIRSDSELLVRQVNGQYSLRAPNLRPLFIVILLLSAKLPMYPRLTYVPRECNKAGQILETMKRRTA